jgi:hypothetical protein
MQTALLSRSAALCGSIKNGVGGLIVPFVDLRGFRLCSPARIDFGHAVAEGKFPRIQSAREVPQNAACALQPVLFPDDEHCRVSTFVVGGQGNQDNVFVCDFSVSHLASLSQFTLPHAQNFRPFWYANHVYSLSINKKKESSGFALFGFSLRVLTHFDDALMKFSGGASLISLGEGIGAGIRRP